LPTASDFAAVRSEELTKSYRLGQHQTLDRTVRKVLRREVASLNPVLPAVDRLSFEIPRGVAFAIMGRNGSGKSTVCQMIAGITQPTGGRLQVRGHIIPVLALGMGFSAELTGRENIVILGSMLGIPRAQTIAAIPDIARFAEIESHIDTPVKRWSFGMGARLYVAIAVCFEADVYIFDEISAVVDDEFRERCMAEMKALVRAGRTVIFISHNMESVRQLCTEGMWLDKGRLRSIGPIDEVTAAYEAAQHHLEA
jgi:lipopolysaccharide transport system ATP-binding protein